MDWMSVEEKALAFVQLAGAFTKQWGNGRWSWWCHTPSGGKTFATREEAIADLVVYACREAKHMETRGKWIHDIIARDNPKPFPEVL